MTGYGANSFTACGLLFGLYGYLGQANFLQMLGLVVAIPSIMFYTFLYNKTARIIDEIDEHTVKLINLLTGNR